jgi:alpha-glucosidase
MRSVLDEYGERMMVGEIYLPLERLVTYYGAQGSGVHLPFNFQLIELPWHARALADAIDRYEAQLPSYGWPNWVLGNHDNPRIASRIGAAQARVAAMLLLTLRGTPTLYYGDELGMHNVPIPPDQVQDPFEKNVPGIGVGRDPERTPMQWSAAENAGFTGGTPWLPIAEDYPRVNVATASADPKSMLALYRKLLHVRRREPSLSIGLYTPLPAQGDVLAYRRQFEGSRRFLVVLNLASEATVFQAPHGNAGKIAISTHLDHEGEPVAGPIELRADEGLLIELMDT